MRVRGLYKFQVLHARHCFENVNMIQYIAIWKSMHVGQQPVLIIDIVAILRSILRSDMRETLCGGRNHIYFKQLDCFFGRLQAMGVRMIFSRNFGAEFSRPYPVLCRKVDAKYAWTMEFYKNMELAPRGDNHFPKLGVYNYMDQMIQQYGEYCDDNRPFKLLQLSHYYENLVGVISARVEYMAYQLDQFQYWSCVETDLNMDSMEVMAFHQLNLVQYFDLTMIQYHILMAVMALLSDSKVSNFLRAMSDPLAYEGVCWHLRNFYYMADEIRYNMTEVIDTQIDFFSLSSRIFNTNELNTTIFATQMSENYQKFHFLQVPLEEIDRPNSDDLTPFETAVFFHNRELSIMLRNQPIHCRMDMVDLDELIEAQMFSMLYLRVQKRLGGIVKHGRRRRNVPQKLVMKWSHDQAAAVHHVNNEFPPATVQVLDVVDMLFNRGPFDKYKQWDMFLWILDVKSSPQFIDLMLQMPRDMQSLSVTAFFLLREGQIDSREAVAILLIEWNVVADRCDDLIDVPNRFNGRWIRVAHLYVQTRCLVNKCLEICGIEAYRDHIMFDAVYFHYLMEELEVDQDNRMEEFYEMFHCIPCFEMQNNFNLRYEDESEEKANTEEQTPKC